MSGSNSTTTVLFSTLLFNRFIALPIKHKKAKHRFRNFLILFSPEFQKKNKGSISDRELEYGLAAQNKKNEEKLCRDSSPQSLLQIIS